MISTQINYGLIKHALGKVDMQLYFQYIVGGVPYRSHLDVYITSIRGIIEGTDNLNFATLYLRELSKLTPIEITLRDGTIVRLKGRHIAKTVKMVVLNHYYLVNKPLLWDTERGFYV